MTAGSTEPDARRALSAIDSVAYALCAHDESGDADYGNDHLAELIVEQLVADGHVVDGSDTVLHLYPHGDRRAQAEWLRALAAVIENEGS